VSFADQETWEALGWLVAVAVAALVLVEIVSRIVARVAANMRQPLGEWLANALRGPLRLLVPGLAVQAVLPSVGFADPTWVGIVSHALTIVVIVAVGWLAIASTGILEQAVSARYDLSASDNLRARRAYTKFVVLRRTVVVIVGTMTFAAVLWTFPAAQSLGTGIFASAGIAGIAIGIAARPTLETLLAGVQLALTEPINIDDVVIVEGEWGRVEEIRATYVVVRIWDLRRLIVPLQYFISQPFQNWTRVSADLLGAVTVDVDYRTPVDQVRAAVEKMVAASPLWDRNFWNLQVVDAGPATMRLRVLVTAADSSKAFDLRCEVRENLIAWLQENHPESLPRVRLESGDASSGQP